MTTHPLTPALSQEAIVLFAHGSSDPSWAQPIEAIKTELSRLQPEKCVAIAYLERATPSLLEAATMLAQQGITRIRILPIFLGVGKHLKADLPILIAEFTEQHPHVSVDLLPALGEHPKFAPWVASLFVQASTQTVGQE